MKGSSVHAQNINKSFGSVHVLKDVTIQIEKGEFFSLLGPSGCGKTTLLRLIAGFDTPDTGIIALGDMAITQLPPNERPVNTVFQSYALFPHLSVFENVAFPLRLRKIPEQTINDSVGHYLQLVKLDGHSHKAPAQLSGGQRQRVAIARALISEPQVLLLDEPLSALDAKLRHQLLIELDKIHDEVGITFIYVTHDQSEALGVSDRIAIMNEGRILQIGSSHSIYDAPANAFVASFIGETNLFDAQVLGLTSDTEMSLHVEGLGAFTLSGATESLTVGQTVQLSLRPEKINVTKQPHPQSTGVLSTTGMVDEIVYSGYQSRVFVKTSTGQLLKTLQTHTTHRTHDLAWKDAVHAWWRTDDMYLIRP